MTPAVAPVLNRAHGTGAPQAGEWRAALHSMDAALHDLSQPLTSIALALEVLARERDPETLQALLVASRQECVRAMRDVATLRAQTNNMLHGAVEDAEGLGR